MYCEHIRSTKFKKFSYMSKFKMPLEYATNKNRVKRLIPPILYVSNSWNGPNHVVI